MQEHGQRQARIGQGVVKRLVHGDAALPRRHFKLVPAVRVVARIPVAVELGIGFHGAAPSDYLSLKRHLVRGRRGEEDVAVVLGVVRDYQRAAQQRANGRPHVGKRGRILHHLIRDVVNGDSAIRNRDGGSDQRVEQCFASRVEDGEVAHLRAVQASCLGVENDNWRLLTWFEPCCDQANGGEPVCFQTL